MSLNNYRFAIVKKIFTKENQDVIGDDTVLVLAQPYRARGLDLLTVSQPIRSVIKEGDFVVVDLSVAVVPNSNSTAPRKEIVKIIRNNTREEIDALYRDVVDSALKKPHEETTEGVA